MIMMSPHFTNKYEYHYEYYDEGGQSRTTQDIDDT